MSFGTAMKNLGTIPEVLTLALLVSSIFALFYLDMSMEYRIGVTALVFAVAILSSITTQILRVLKEIKKGKNPQ
ncbi:MAG: hypothetical protein NWF01_01140 [Candidatus Bathyarchaeota archaeon]|nr:hypothetical protein [Candidatus Bathyarchaeota archaeon]